MSPCKERGHFRLSAGAEIGERSWMTYVKVMNASKCMAIWNSDFYRVCKQLQWRLPSYMQQHAQPKGQYPPFKNKHCVSYHYSSKKQVSQHTTSRIGMNNPKRGMHGIRADRAEPAIKYLVKYQVFRVKSKPPSIILVPTMLRALHRFRRRLASIWKSLCVLQCVSSSLRGSPNK